MLPAMPAADEVILPDEWAAPDDKFTFFVKLVVKQSLVPLKTKGGLHYVGQDRATALYKQLCKEILEREIQVTAAAPTIMLQECFTIGAACCNSCLLQ